VPKNDPNAEVESFDTYPFSYNMYYQVNPWIHRKYPKPMTSTRWDKPSNQFLADNATFDADGKLYWYGDIGWQNNTRSGTPANAATGLSSGWVVEDWDGDSSAWLGAPGGVTPTHVLSIFDLEEKQDNVKRECQLWAKFRKATLRLENGLYYYDLTEWTEPEIIHSAKWDEPIGPMIIVDVPSKYFNGPDGVELRYFCTDPCGADTTDGTTWTINGQASYITESVIEFPLDLCKSYGKGETTVNFQLPNCPQPSFTVINKSEKMFISTSQSCGYQYGFGVSFFYTGYLCERPSDVCVPLYNNPYYCCDNLFGGYTTQPDGTITCGPHHQIPPGSYFGEDRYNRVLIDSKTAIFNGVWTNYPASYTYFFDCRTFEFWQDAPQEYKIGSVLVNGV
jgi:hypothetical protein